MRIDMEIRRAAKEDIPAAAALEAACFPLGADLSALERMRTFSDRVLLCAAEGGEVLGYAYFQFVLDEGYVGDLAVRPDRRREGIGAALVDAMCAEGRRLGLSFLTLEVRESNLPARALYAGQGFVDVGVRRGYYEKPRENAVLMTRTLGE